METEQNHRRKKVHAKGNSKAVRGDKRIDIEALAFAKKISKQSEHQHMRNLAGKPLRELMRASGILMVNCIYWMLIRREQRTAKSSRERSND